MKIEDQRQKAAQAARTCLEEISFLKVAGIELPEQTGLQQPDLLVRVSMLASDLLLLVEVGRNGEPKEARNAAQRLLLHQKQYPLAYGVFVAPYITAATGNLCAELGIGYIDFAGNCRLSFGQVYIRKEIERNPVLTRRPLRSLYSPKAERVLRVLLKQPSQPWKMQALAAEAQVSLGQVANVKELLEEKEWIQENREGFALNAPEALLKEWTENYKHHQITWNMYSMNPPPVLEGYIAKFFYHDKGFPQSPANFALTGLAAANRYAPYARNLRTSVYINGDESFLNELACAIGLRQVPSGANVTLIIPYDEGVFYDARLKPGDPVVWSASPIQVYLDLSARQGREREAAEFLFDEVIKPSW